MRGAVLLAACVLVVCCTADVVVLTNVTFPYALADNVAASLPGAGFAVGVTLNQPRYTLFFDGSSGKQKWAAAFDGDVHVAVSRILPLVLAGEVDVSGTGAVIQLFDTSSGQSLFRYTVGPMEMFGAVGFAAAGHLFAVLTGTIDYGKGSQPMVRLFEITDPAHVSNSSVKLVSSYEGPHMSGDAGLALSADGSKVFLLGTAMLSRTSAESFVSVLDVDPQTRQLKLLQTVSVETSGGAFCVSDDGRSFAAGFDYIRVYDFDDKHGMYVNLENVTDAGYLLSACAYDSTNRWLALGLSTDAVNDVQLQVLDRTQRFAMFGRFLYPSDVGSLQDQVSQIAFPHGSSRFVAAVNWGDGRGLPTAYAFEIAPQTLRTMAAVSTPGSMFGVDVLVDASRGKLTFTAAGKLVHANIMGYGSSIVVVQTDIDAV